LNDWNFGAEWFKTLKPFNSFKPNAQVEVAA
jgi:hypothetical protein